MQSSVVTGNALFEGKKRWGWFIGHFITPSHDLRSTTDLEVKWGVHAKGDRRTDWTVDTQVTSLSVLIAGRFRLEFVDRSVVLAEQGDYVLWVPGVEHSWEAEADSTVLTVRFPSVPKS